MKKYVSLIFGFVLLSLIILFGFGIYLLIGAIWNQFKILDKEISVAILTAATTVLVATLTIVLGKYYERKKDIEAHYRQKKTEIYDEFLREFFNIFNSSIESKNQDDSNLVNFLREWQRKIILWGGEDVLISYIKWMNHIRKNQPDAKAMYMMEDFFLKMRKDLGHSNSRITKGSFIYFILQEADLFLAESNKNPNITLEELSMLEKKSAILP